MLLDANLDGAISPEELMKVMNFVKAGKAESLSKRSKIPYGVKIPTAGNAYL